MHLSSIYNLVLYFPLIYRYIKATDELKSKVKEDLNSFLKIESTEGLANIYIYIYLAKCLKSEYFRSVFYNKVGRLTGLFKNYKPSSPKLIISPTCHIDGGIKFHHPYNTIINAKYIGRNFTFRHLTTIGNKVDGRNDLIPSIGNNVTLGANVIIIGDIEIGDNVIVGAGSVVTKSIPSNTIVAGNPARIIKYE